MRISLRNLTNTLSLRQMAAVSIAGGLLAVSGFVIPISHHNRFFWLEVAASLFCVVLGFLISFQAESDIQSGIANERWPEDDVIWMRAVTLSPYLLLVTAILLLAGGLSLVLSSDRHYFGSSIWPYLILIQTLTRLANATKEPRTERTMELTPRTLAPLHSAHWGQR